MEINSQLPQTSLYNLFNAQKEHAQAQEAPAAALADKKAPPAPTASTTEATADAQSKQRETYGLLVLELMSNDEYNAFKRATAGMSEGDKMLAAQSLYSLTNFYNGKFNPDLKTEAKTQTNPYEKNAQKAFGIQTQNLNNFLERYKNAYDSSSEFDMTL